MPWNECKPMDERLKFIARLLDGNGWAGNVAAQREASRATRRQTHCMGVFAERGREQNVVTSTLEVLPSHRALVSNCDRCIFEVSHCE